ncbi:hypothetical protein RUND412_004845 [Rhizina undulata]
MVLIKNALALFCSFTVVTSLPLVKRDATTVQSDLSTISTDIDTLSSAIISYTGDLIGALTVAVAANTLNTDVQKGTVDTTASSDFDITDSLSVTSAALTLTPKLITTLNEWILKEPSFAQISLNALVALQLTMLKTSSDNLSSALQNKTQAIDKLLIAAAQTNVDAAFETAIAAYST